MRIMPPLRVLRVALRPTQSLSEYTRNSILSLLLFSVYSSWSLGYFFSYLPILLSIAQFFWVGLDVSPHKWLTDAWVSGLSWATNFTRAAILLNFFVSSSASADAWSWPRP